MMKHGQVRTEVADTQHPTFQHYFQAQDKGLERMLNSSLSKKRTFSHLPSQSIKEGTYAIMY